MMIPTGARRHRAAISILPFAALLIASPARSLELVPGHPLLLSAEDAKPDNNAPSDDYKPNGYTEYGDFNMQGSEDADTRFLEYGRLFGVSLGMGYEGALGNRGKLWNGGFPAIEIKLHYWFDFHLALDLGVFLVSQFYVAPTSGAGAPGTTPLGQVSVNVSHLGANLRYYFDTKDLSAPLSFANPYVLVGAGEFSKSETSQQNVNVTGTDSGLGLNAGVGLEFVVSPRSTYFELEGKIYTVTFQDTYTDQYATQGIPDLTGPLYTFTAGFLFTW